MKFFKITFTFILLVTFTINVKCKDKTNIYVWDFTTPNSKTNALTDQLTNAFDQKLVKIGQPKYRVLNRTEIADVIQHCENENAIMEIDINSITNCSSDELKFHRAEAVVFGTVDDDEESGLVTVQITFQAFTGEILAKESIDIERYKTKNSIDRKKQMEILVRKLLGKFRTPNIVAPVTTMTVGVSISAIGLANFFRIEDECILKESKTIQEWEIYNRKYKKNQVLAYAGGAVFIAGVYWLIESKRAKKIWEQHYVTILPEVGSIPSIAQIQSNQSIGIKLAYKF